MCFLKFFFSKRAFLTLSPSSVWDAECFPEKASVPTSYSADSNLLQKLFVIIQSTTCLGSLMSITRHIRTPKLWKVYSSASVSTNLVHLWNWILKSFLLGSAKTWADSKEKKRFFLPLIQWEGLRDTPHLFCAFQTLQHKTYESLSRDLIFMFLLVAKK